LHKANSVWNAQCDIEAGITSDDVTGSHYTEYLPAWQPSSFTLCASLALFHLALWHCTS